MGEGGDSQDQRKGKDKRKEDDDNQSMSGYSTQPGELFFLLRDILCKIISF